MVDDGEGNLSYGAYTKGSSFSDIYNAVSSGDASDFYIYITNTGGTYGQTYLPVPMVTFGTEADTTKYFSASMNDGTNTYHYYMSETGGVGIRINEGDYVNGTWTYDPDTMTYTISDGENPENNT